MLGLGDTVWMPTPKGGGHLWVILTAPRQGSGDVLIANVTSLRPGSDTTVILRKGDHPYVIHDSVVFYADCSLVDLAKLQEAVDLPGDAFTQCDSCSAELLRRIQDGLLASVYTSNKVKDYFRESQRLGLCSK